MTYDQACHKAKRLSVKKETEFFIIYDFEEYEKQYQVCNTEELDTFFAGNVPICGYDHGVYFE